MTKAVLAAGLALATATNSDAATNYGDFSDIPPGSVMYLDVTESSGTTPAPSYGAPDITGNLLDFDPTVFAADATDGDSELIDGQLNFDVMADDGFAISSLLVTEGGDYSLFGTGSGATQVAAALSVSVEILEVDGLVVGPPNDGGLNVSFTDSFTGTPQLLDDWSLAALVDFDAILADNNIDFVLGVTKAEVVIDNQLIAISEDLSTAFIAKKDFKTVVAALYRFARLPGYADLRGPVLDKMQAHGVRGTLLLASEGVNGTIAGSREGIDAVLSFLKSQPALNALTHKESFCDEMPFRRTKVRLKKEIVTMGVEGVDPLHVVGTYVKPEDWNELIADPDVTLIDTRNDYEVELGTFEGAIDPKTESFREFPGYAKETLKPGQTKKVAMFCTGGIRCEKATAYVKALGFEEVYHLEGGILKYLEEVPQDKSKWQGECFVFDERVSVGHGLTPGPYALCYACRMPISDQDMLSEHYRKGISCPRCIDQVDPERRARFEQRQKQAWVVAATAVAAIGLPQVASATERGQAPQQVQDDRNNTRLEAQQVAAQWIDALLSADMDDAMSLMRLPAMQKHQDRVLNDLEVIP
eukprot:g14863.t1